MNFSFVVEDVLAGCAHPARLGDTAAALRELHELGIRSVVSLDEAGLPKGLLAEHGLRHLHLPIDDFCPPSLDQATRFVDFVRSEREQRRPVVAHCAAGIGRTGTMLSCYLVSTGMSATAAIAHVRRVRPGSVETGEQAGFVHEFERHLRAAQ